MAYSAENGKERQRELMQTLIQSDELLVTLPDVFNLRVWQRNGRRSAVAKSIAPLKDHIYGFESLIRTTMPPIKKIVLKVVDSKYLRPDAFFNG